MLSGRLSDIAYCVNDEEAFAAGVGRSISRNLLRVAGRLGII
jgi:hypothetical protein